MVGVRGLRGVLGGERREDVLAQSVPEDATGRAVIQVRLCRDKLWYGRKGKAVRNPRHQPDTHPDRGWGVVYQEAWKAPTERRGSSTTALPWDQPCP